MADDLLHGTGGSRVPYEALPPAVSGAVEAHLGAAVVAATDQPGGFSPGVAARLRLADGRRAFVKAVDGDRHPRSAALHRRERRVAAALPRRPELPDLLAAFERNDWVVLLFADVDGRLPRLPWQPEEADRVLAAVDRLGRELTPSPAPIEPIADTMADFGGWQRFAAAPELQDRLDRWAAGQLPRLAALEARWLDATAGDTLLHLDLRADNLLVTDEAVVVVDWPWAAVGAAWVDPLLLLPSMVLQGAGDPEALLARSRALAAAPRHDVDAALAALAGFFTWHALQPPLPGVERVRELQAAQGRVCVDWLRRRLG